MKRSFALAWMLIGLLGFSFSALAAPDPAYVYPGVSEVGENFIPPGCTVEDWCLVSASPRCKFVGMTHPNGLYQAHFQYSIIRRAYVNCGYDRRVITGPVETMPFSSSIQGSDWAARSEIYEICETMREDWVSQAPRCDAE